jgi:sec-independent protein translocase protein TatB
VTLGLTFEKAILILLIAALVIGPERLPIASEKLAQLVRGARTLIETGKQRVQNEIGQEVDPDSWRKLDPRQYDPRRIIRDALLEDSTVTQPEERGDRAAPAFGIHQDDIQTRKAPNVQ